MPSWGSSLSMSEADLVYWFIPTGIDIIKRILKKSYSHDLCVLPKDDE